MNPIPPDVCGPAAAAGVLLPSVDAVGRQFPLTLVAVSSALRVDLALPAALPWFKALEEVGREAWIGIRRWRRGLWA